MNQGQPGLLETLGRGREWEMEGRKEGEGGRREGRGGGRRGREGRERLVQAEPAGPLPRLSNPPPQASYAPSALDFTAWQDRQQVIWLS